MNLDALLVLTIRASALLIKFLFTLFLARYLGFEALGYYGLIAGASIAFPAIFGLGINYTLVRNAATQSPNEITQTLGLYLRYLVLLYAVIIVCVGTLNSFNVTYVIVVVILFLEHVNNDIYLLLLNLSKSRLANVLFFIRSAVWMSVYMISAYQFESVRNTEILLQMWVCGLTASLFIFFIHGYKWPWNAAGNKKPLHIWLINEFKIANNLYAQSILRTGSTYLDRYIINLFLGIELTGVYVFFWTVHSALYNLVFTGVIQFSRPKLLVEFKNKSNSYLSTYRNCLRNSILVSMSLGFAATAVLYVILPLLNKPIVIEWFPLLLLILAGFVFNVIGTVQELIFYSQFRDDLILKITFFWFVVTIVLDLTLIKYFGLWGASLAFLFGNIYLVLSQKYVLKGFIKPLSDSDEKG